MQLTEARLREIVVSEVIEQLLEQVIEEELDRFFLENEDNDDLVAYKKAYRADLISKVKKGLVPMALAGTLFGVLGQKTTDHADIKAAETELIQQANIEKANTDEAQLDKFADQLNNTARYMWGVGDQGAMPVPGTDGKITVLPPSYSIAVRAFLDKKANMERIASGEEPVMRYGELDLENIPQIGGDYSYQGSYEENVDEFFDAYSGKDMVDAMSVLQKVPELNVVSGTGTEERIIMVNPNNIDPTYILPELGMTAADYYNSQYGTFLGSGESAAIDGPEDEKAFDPDAEINPELVQNTVKRSQRDIDNLQKKRLKEHKITWKNYKNRQKKLA